MNFNIYNIHINEYYFIQTLFFFTFIIHIQEITVIRSFTRESIIESIVDLINYLQQDQNLRKTVHSKIYILKRRCKLTNFIDLQSNLNNFKKYISRYNTLQWKLTINSQQFLKHEELEHKLLIEVHKLNSEVSFSQ